MPNRILKESITTSVSLANLSAEEERHFYRLIVQADDFGCFQAHAAIIRAKGYALLLGKVSDEQSESWTQALVGENIIHLYESDGKRYGHFVNWGRYQQVRAKNRKYPEPSCEITCNQMISNDISRNQMHPYSYSETYSETKTETRNEDVQRQPKRADSFELPAWIDKDVWAVFLDMRRKVKAMPTVHAMTLLIGKLEKLQADGNDPNEVLRESTMNNWKGVFPLKGRQTGGKAPKVGLDGKPYRSFDNSLEKFIDLQKHDTQIGREESDATARDRIAADKIQHMDRPA